jgi:hypothetical protein
MIGSYNPRDVLVLTDSGYDNKKIENAIADQHWTFIMALGKTRSVKSETLYLTTSKSKQWSHVATFFRHHRRLKWTTIRLMTNGAKAKRMEFRIRHTMGYLRYVGRVQLVCSEPKNRPEGRRRYLACNDVRVTARQIMMGYRLRWAVEIYQSCNLRRTLFGPKIDFFGFYYLQLAKILDNESHTGSIGTMISPCSLPHPLLSHENSTCRNLTFASLTIAIPC